MDGPRIRLRALMIAVAVCAVLLGWDRRLARTIDAPDLVAVDVRPAVPGRPISGVRLVRPDGTVTLGCYGMVRVAGLTAEEAEAKITAHLRPYVSDEPQSVAVAIAEKNAVTGLSERAIRSIRRKTTEWIRRVRRRS